MKNIHRLFATLLFASMFVVGCKDECKDVDCGNGECVDGLCVCSDGYFGSNCSTALNAAMNGTYQLTELCNTSGNWNYSIQVAPKSGSLKEATITGFYQENNDAVTAVVAVSGTSFTIANQDLGTSGYKLAATNGQILDGGKTLKLTYAITGSNGSAVESCTATLTR
jgi:hypothetical protein